MKNNYAKRYRNTLTRSVRTRMRRKGPRRLRRRISLFFWIIISTSLLGIYVTSIFIQSKRISNSISRTRPKTRYLRRMRPPMIKTIRRRKRRKPLPSSCSKSKDTISSINLSAKLCPSTMCSTNKPVWIDSSNHSFIVDKEHSRAFK